MSLEVHSFPYQKHPVELLSQCADFTAPVLLHSARYHPTRGRYSYFAAEPLRYFQQNKCRYGDDPFQKMRALQGQIGTPRVADLPPFQGGWVGLLGYELGHCWERLPAAVPDFFLTPALAVGLYDWCVCWDHQQQQAWLLFQSDLEQHVGKNSSRQHWPEIKSQLLSHAGNSPLSSPDATEEIFANSIHSNHTSEQYCQRVQQVIDYIAQGDIYQANLSRKLEFAYSGAPQDLYRWLVQSNPAPFSAYFQPETDWAILSASPEQFLQVDQKEVITRPIKGTRPRSAAGDLDLLQAAALLDSVKDRAENTMIVDLLRNDLSRVCQTGSVKVPRYCELETFEKVHHLVSEVTGTLRDDASVWDLFAATFPGGSITGAPKIRAMEIITELEQITRGAYCGSLFAAGLDGSLQSNLLIRTLTWKQGRVQCPVGGGIVADSIPQQEYFETVHKSQGLIPEYRGQYLPGISPSRS